MPEQTQPDEIIPRGEEIVERFGGIRPMAAKLNVPVTTVQGWKKRDAIPAVRRDEILSAAALHNINLKGLVSEDVANQNTRGNPAGSAGVRGGHTTASEDPALAQPAQAPSSGIKNQTQAKTKTASNGVDDIDLESIRSAARTTSLVTTASLAVILLGAGFLLFGKSVSPEKIGSLEARMGAVETRVNSFASTDTGTLSQTVADLQTRVGELSNTVSMSFSQRLDALEQQLRAAGNAPLAGAVGQIQSMTQTPEGQAQLQGAVDELRTLVSGLQGKTTTLADALNGLRGETNSLGALLSQVSTRDVGAAALLLALNELRDATGRGAPFTEDLSLLRDIAAATDPELAASVDRLAPYAATGVLSSDGLKRELVAAAADIAAAESASGSASWKDRLIARLQGLFSIRKDGVPVAASQPTAPLQNALALLDAGNVAGALEAVRALNVPASQTWEAKAAGAVYAQELDSQIVRTLVLRIRNGLSGVPQPVNLAPQQAPMADEPAVMAPETGPEAGIPDTPMGETMQDMPAPDNGGVISQ